MRCSWLWMTSLALVACRPPDAGTTAVASPTAAAPPSASAVPPPAPPPAGPRSPAVCAAWSGRPKPPSPAPLASFTTAPCAKAAEDYAAAMKVVPKGAKDVSDAVEAAFRCVPTQRDGKVDGAFATALDGARMKDGAFVATLLLVVTDAKGARLFQVAPAAAPAPAKEGTASKETFLVKMNDEVDGVDALQVFDVGAAQHVAFLATSAGVAEGGTRSRGQLFTVQSAAAASGAARSSLAPYTPGGMADLSPVEVWDADADGHVDLLYAAPFVLTYASESGADYMESGPLFLAHAKGDGTFDTNDALAKDVASCACPSATAASDADSALGAVACARVWGVDPGGAVAKRCGGQDAPADCRSQQLRALFGARAAVSLP